MTFASREQKNKHLEYDMPEREFAQNKTCCPKSEGQGSLTRVSFTQEGGGGGGGAPPYKKLLSSPPKNLQKKNVLSATGVRHVCNRSVLALGDSCQSLLSKKALSIKHTWFLPKRQ